MAECSKPDCVEARRQRDAYRDAGPTLVNALLVAIADVAVSPLSKDFNAADVLYVAYTLLNMPRMGCSPEDIEIQNLARIKIDALINRGAPND